MNKKIILLPIFLSLILISITSAVYVTEPNGLRVWENSTQLFQNITNSSSPIGAIGHVINTGLPFFWPIFPFILYLYLFIIYSDSPSGGKLYMIAGLVFVISVFMAFAGLIPNAIINFAIFAATFFLANQFNKGHY